MKSMCHEVFVSSDLRNINQNPEMLEFQPMWDSVHRNVSDNVCMQIVMKIWWPPGDIFREIKAIDSTR